MYGFFTSFVSGKGTQTHTVKAKMFFLSNDQ